MLTLLVARVLPALRGGLRTLRASDGPDGAARLLARAVSGLPEHRASWGAAMQAELEELADERERRRYSLGCVRGVIAIRIMAAVTLARRDGRGLRAAVLGAIAASGALAAYGVVRYPGLVTGDGSWAAAAFLIVALPVYAGCALALSQGVGRPARLARRNGLIGGVVAGAAWLAVLEPTSALRAWVAVPLAVALLAPAGLAAHTARAGGDVRAARATAAWSGLVGGLLASVVLTIATYVRDGGPYDPQLLRDFHRSGSHDLVAYAVGDSLGVALGLLALIPLLALAFGSLTAGPAAGRRGR